MKESVLCKSATRPCVGRAADARLSGDRYCLIREIVNRSAGCQSLLLEVGEHTALEPFGFLEVSVRHIGGHVCVALAHVLHRKTDGDASQVSPAIKMLRFQGSSHIHRARRHRFARFLQGVLLIAIAFGVQCLAAFVQIGVVQVGVCLHRLRERMVSGYPLH